MVAAVMADATQVHLVPLTSFANLRTAFAADTSQPTREQRTVQLLNRERTLLDRAETADRSAGFFELNRSADRVAMIGGAPTKSMSPI